MEGDTTNFYIYRKLQKKGIKMSLISRGIGIGSQLEYIDELIAKLKPSVNWKKQLRKFAANGEKTYLIPTLKRRSKRYNWKQKDNSINIYI